MLANAGVTTSEKLKGTRMAKNKQSNASKVRWAFKQKHYAEVTRVLKTIFAGETSDTVMNDGELVRAVMDAGVFCSKTVIQKVRVDMKVPSSDQRIVELFAREHRQKK